MYFYCFFSFEYFDPFDHYAACWVTLTITNSISGDDLTSMTKHSTLIDMHAFGETCLRVAIVTLNQVNTDKSFTTMEKIMLISLVMRGHQAYLLQLQMQYPEVVVKVWFHRQFLPKSRAIAAAKNS